MCVWREQEANQEMSCMSAVLDRVRFSAYNSKLK